MSAIYEPKGKAMNAKHIIKGWAKLIAQKLGITEADKEAISRLNICANCKLRTAKDFCNPNATEKVVKDFVYNGKKRKVGDEVNGCGCYLPAKVLVNDSQCPIGAWVK